MTKKKMSSRHRTGRAARVIRNTRTRKWPDTTIVLDNRTFTELTLGHDLSHSLHQIIHLRLIRSGQTWVTLYRNVRCANKNLLSRERQNKNRPTIWSFGIDTVFAERLPKADVLENDMTPFCPTNKLTTRIAPAIDRSNHAAQT